MMNITLKGKSALITGSTLGIGFVIAQSLAAAGASVYLNGRSNERVAKAVQDLRKSLPHATISGIVADLQTAEGAKQVYAEAGEVDILVNNMGIFEPKPFFEITDADWQKFFEVNVMSAVRMSRHFTPRMVEKKWGRVIFIASEAAIQVPVEMIHYAMTKTALLSISRGLAQTVAGSGVTVNAILPGPTRSEGVETFVRQMASDPNKKFEELEEEFFRTSRPGSLIRRFITPQEVANLVTYVASEEASATTGAALRVDGGLAQSLL